MVKVYCKRVVSTGPWFFHCHIDWHLNAGFGMCPSCAQIELPLTSLQAAVFVEDQPDVANVDHPPRTSALTSLLRFDLIISSVDWELLCPAWNLYSIINNLETGLESLKPTETTNPVNVSSLSLPDIDQ